MSQDISYFFKKFQQLEQLISQKKEQAIESETDTLLNKQNSAILKKLDYLIDLFNVRPIKIKIK